MPTIRGDYNIHKQFLQKEWKRGEYCEGAEIQLEEETEVPLRQKTLYLVNRLRGLRVAGYVLVSTRIWIAAVI